MKIAYHTCTEHSDVLKRKLLTAIPTFDSFPIVLHVRFLNTTKSIADTPFMLARQTPNEPG